VEDLFHVVRPEVSFSLGFNKSAYGVLFSPSQTPPPRIPSLPPWAVGPTLATRPSTRTPFCPDFPGFWIVAGLRFPSERGETSLFLSCFREMRLSRGSSEFFLHAFPLSSPSLPSDQWATSVFSHAVLRRVPTPLRTRRLFGPCPPLRDLGVRRQVLLLPPRGWPTSSLCAQRSFPPGVKVLIRPSRTCPRCRDSWGSSEPFPRRELWVFLLGLIPLLFFRPSRALFWQSHVRIPIFATRFFGGPKGPHRSFFSVPSSIGPPAFPYKAILGRMGFRLQDG